MSLDDGSIAWDNDDLPARPDMAADEQAPTPSCTLTPHDQVAMR